ncbi:uncharacterized protein EDB91DRAFT_672321 [Suillus paluster]|uniref:uncharacterized protein n=1 Tax=Suillus paluster TaxID=48578 RepID=UPI001B87C466|nr:uncharacterized protein EDB91DRAFT_672321 [Suillus paluster]KAG1732393.1 hypothetical protein EDB91DRAFT_672321 [Suillus paluster]
MIARLSPISSHYHPRMTHFRGLFHWQQMIPSNANDLYFPFYDPTRNRVLPFRVPQFYLQFYREIVSSPDFTPSSVAQIVNSCAAALPTIAEFTNLLQQPNIEGHMALYLAIVNNQREVLSAFTKFISEFSPDCSSDLRLASMGASDHGMFMQLNLGSNLSQDESLRRFLGCPPHEIQVHEGGGLSDSHFVTLFHFRVLQKRLRITQKLGVKFVARGRI